MTTEEKLIALKNQMQIMSENEMSELSLAETSLFCLALQAVADIAESLLETRIKQEENDRQ